MFVYCGRKVLVGQACRPHRAPKPFDLIAHDCLTNPFSWCFIGKSLANSAPLPPSKLRNVHRLRVRPRIGQPAALSRSVISKDYGQAAARGAVVRAGSAYPWRTALLPCLPLLTDRSSRQREESEKPRFSERRQTAASAGRPPVRSVGMNLTVTFLHGTESGPGCLRAKKASSEGVLSVADTGKSTRVG